MDKADIDIAAPPEAVYDLVSDVTRMGKWSPECYRAQWLDGNTGPRLDARFKGWNRDSLGPIPLRWSTVSQVTAAERGEIFAFTTKQSAATWTFQFLPIGNGTGTHLVQTREDGDKSLPARIFATVVPGRDRKLTEGMNQTLARVKAAAEAGEGPAPDALR